ncbi:MAG TPA: serine/threonine-protein kinase, partial [Polyangiaceae bacterium LLY-WYZ-15_(1-7)]|nr:serine/threonine-protein kinase [Polyangiaceae bacterium LLY-WYZ-15_(1-7)]
MSVASTPTEVALAGRYHYLRELGRGASGRVLLASDGVDGPRRALKLVPAAAAGHLLAELDVLTRVAHPGLARVHELLRLDQGVGAPFHLAAGSAVLVEEHVEGRTALAFVERWPVGERARRQGVLRILAEVGRALAALHDAGLLHGDVKPENVLVGGERVVLVDLGLAGPPLAGDGRVRGTPGFLAPEAWSGVRSVATDLWAFGALAHALLGGERSAAPSRPERFVEGPGPLPPEVPPPLAAWVETLLARAPEERPPDVRDALRRLAAAASQCGERVELEDVLEVAPSPAALALRARALPWVGDRDRLDEALATLRSRHRLRIGGPPGSGRTRFARELVRALQRARFEAGGAVPTYARRTLPAGEEPVVLQVRGPASAEVLRSVRAAAELGREVFLIEDGVDAPPASSHDDAPERGFVSLTPLGEEAFDELLGTLLGSASTEVRRAARRATGRLAGGLCRRVAQLWEAGEEPGETAAWEAAPGARSDGQAAAALPSAPMREAALEVAERLAVAGGGLPIEKAGPPAAVRALLGAGRATLDGERLELRDDLRDALQPSPSRQAEIAEALGEVDDPVARVYLAFARGERDAAREALERAVRGARERGDPVSAARLAGEGWRRFELPGFFAAEVDALRAAGRYEEALAVLRIAPERAPALHAEVARQAGRREEAEAALARAPESAATATTAAWLALSAGRLEEAAARAPEGAAEVRAWLALSRGRPAEAEAQVVQGLEAARGLARARLLQTRGSVLQARGDRAAARGAFEAARVAADALGERHLAATAAANLGIVQLEEGRLGAGMEALRDAAG